MTTTRYFMARFGQAFGLFRRNQRMGDAASEMHLLREAEAYLGEMVWEKVEAIDELSVEYWNLRKLVKERGEVQARIEECQARLDEAHESRANLLNATSEPLQELLDERVAILTRLEQHARRRDEIVTNAREVRRTYDGLKMKLEVLGKEAGDDKARTEELARLKTRLAELKQKFSTLKEERTQVGAEIEAGDAEIDVIDGKLGVRKNSQRLEASSAFQMIGEANKEMSICRAEIGLLDTQMRQLHAEIGRHVSRHAGHDPACSTAANSQRGLIEVMRALRRSIALNHRLAGTS